MKGEKRKRWRQKLFAPARRKKNMIVLGMIWLLALFYFCVSGFSINPMRKKENWLLENRNIDRASEFEKTSEIGIEIRLKEGEISFYKKEMEPYILNEEESTPIH